MTRFAQKLAVITGAASGIGRELAKELGSRSCDLALCDIDGEGLSVTREECQSGGASGRITTHICDVSNEVEVKTFRDTVMRKHATRHVDLLFNNAGIGGGASFVVDNRSEWDKTFNVCWFGVYYCSRAFMPLLIASSESFLVNISSINGVWASQSSGAPCTAYSAAKFAVRGFSEALIADLRTNAPHVKVYLVIPGHVGTAIIANSSRILGHKSPMEMPASTLGATRRDLSRRGIAVSNMSDTQLREYLDHEMHKFQTEARTTASEAAHKIIEGICGTCWRILIGDDAVLVDDAVRERPDAAYEPAFAAQVQGQTGRPTTLWT
jgi:NAD(P)-dependent dehydrogenase (short-subunit alcohol dehydrogenase family)